MALGVAPPALPSAAMAASPAAPAAGPPAAGAAGWAPAATRLEPCARSSSAGASLLQSPPASALQGGGKSAITGSGSSAGGSDSSNSSNSSREDLAVELPAAALASGGSPAKLELLSSPLGGGGSSSSLRSAGGIRSARSGSSSGVRSSSSSSSSSSSRSSSSGSSSGGSGGEGGGSSSSYASAADSPAGSQESAEAFDEQRSSSLPPSTCGSEYSHAWPAAPTPGRAASGGDGSRRPAPRPLPAFCLQPVVGQSPAGQQQQASALPDMPSDVSPLEVATGKPWGLTANSGASMPAADDPGSEQQQQQQQQQQRQQRQRQQDVSQPIGMALTAAQQPGRCPASSVAMLQLGQLDSSSLRLQEQLDRCDGAASLLCAWARSCGWQGSRYCSLIPTLPAFCRPQAGAPAGPQPAAASGSRIHGSCGPPASRQRHRGQLHVAERVRCWRGSSTRRGAPRRVCHQREWAAQLLACLGARA